MVSARERIIESKILKARRRRSNESAQIVEVDIRIRHVVAVLLMTITTVSSLIDNVMYKTTPNH